MEVMVKVLEKRTRRISPLREETAYKFGLNGTVIEETIGHWVKPLNVIVQFISIFCPVRVTEKGGDKKLITYWIFPWQRKRSLQEKTRKLAPRRTEGTG